MLCLARKPGEKIRIGDNIVVVVVAVRGQSVRLGIEAPAEVTVHREEIAEAIQQEKEDAERK